MASATELRDRIEQTAGKILIGPDDDHIEFTITTEVSHELGYKSLTVGGYDAMELATTEMTTFAMQLTFNVLGNPVRLSPPLIANQNAFFPPEAGVPQGVILIWRYGRTPQVWVERDHYTFSMEFCVLPPFAQPIGFGGELRRF